MLAWIKRIFLAASLVFALSAAVAPASLSRPVLATPDGGTAVGQGTATGVAKDTQDTMCSRKAGVVEITSATAATASASFATLTADQWYSVYTIGDGNGGATACWDDSAAIAPAINCATNDAGCWVDAGASCFGKQKFKDGTERYLGISGTIYCQEDAGCNPIPYDDAGGIRCGADVGCVNEVHLNTFFETAGDITLTPEVPCK